MPGWSQDPRGWPPPEDRRIEHWRVERGLRERLLAAPPSVREDVAAEVYDDLFRLVPWHTGNQRRDADEAAHEERFFRTWRSALDRIDTLVDLGCGDGGLIRRFAPSVRRAFGVEASEVMVRACREAAPANAEFLVGSVVRPPLEDGIADAVISRQVIEHLHPDDAPVHLARMHDVLVAGGRALVETPNRLTGPWDVSRGLTSTPTGLHLREYSVAELAAMMSAAGFARICGLGLPARAIARVPAIAGAARVPVSLKVTEEHLLQRVRRSRRATAGSLLALNVVALVGERP